MSRTVSFTANTTWQEAAQGPLDLVHIPISGIADVYVGSTAPIANSGTILIKPVVTRLILSKSLLSSFNPPLLSANYALRHRRGLHRETNTTEVILAVVYEKPTFGAITNLISD